MEYILYFVLITIFLSLPLYLFLIIIPAKIIKLSDLEKNLEPIFSIKNAIFYIGIEDGSCPPNMRITLYEEFIIFITGLGNYVIYLEDIVEVKRIFPMIYSIKHKGFGIPDKVTIIGLKKKYFEIIKRTVDEINHNQY